MRKRWTLRGLCASTAASVILMASAVGAEQGSETSDPTSETELVILGGGAGRTSYGGDYRGLLGRGRRRRGQIYRGFRKRLARALL